ncbi:hypothetical protein FJT64_012318 [Amphibalanus amphitrite]|uniref:BED-type domain-containing protein n=1 Tax=Amphibalanus amphitrite TaxID=1232801 RepID=A0A6A4VGJ1_AMPAM|nr:hypothetical protein FJT64_012318 [Amphibalanus amphitrite]
MYYVRLSDTTASCRFCGRVIRGAPTSSGNFWVHLKRLHAADIAALGGQHAALAGSWREAAGRRRPAPADEHRLAAQRRSADVGFPPPVRQRSQVWSYFNPRAEGRLQCQMCAAIVAYSNNSTSNLWGHLGRYHQELFATLKSERSRQERQEHAPVGSVLLTLLSGERQNAPV